ncbi:DUF3376 domain-containing protein [Nocardioides rubriscoriae]|uniref:DUF3376 domain-containing protein n=1 Tax=Nocardioides rubriscoriae TaxID=642762 RepID=UPI0011E0127D|nr:DUF3376 domain-containing protein [Nocardioides rubriscoriae]
MNVDPVAPGVTGPSEPHETRFALVLNGGVSLAIWMSGVVHELNRVRLARGPGPDDPAETAVHEAWRAILHATGRSVVIDAVAGTSAGGLNGTLLATAIARGADLQTLKGTWSQIASLKRGKLLRADPRGAPSVLDGEFFARQVDRVVDAITPRHDLDPAECTLLVTATALKPQARRYVLEGELDAHAVDSRRVYQFSRLHDAQGQPERDDFAVTDPAGTSAIAAAARASASFPVAFTPVWETDELSKRRRDRRDDDPQTWLIDGGVLDNAPFEPLLESLRDRSVSRPFDRVVLYLTPGVEAAADPLTDGGAPDVATVMGAVVGAVREPDQREDLATLEESFTRAGFVRSSPHRLMSDLLVDLAGGVPTPFGTVPARAAADALFGVYRTRRLEEVERWLTAIGRVPHLVPPPPLELAGADPPGVPLDGLHDPADWAWGLPAAGRVLRWWGRALVSCSASPALKTDLRPAFAAVDHAQRRVRTLRRVEDHRIEVVVTPDLTPRARLEVVAAALAALDSGPEVAALVVAVTDAVAACFPGLTTGAELAQFALDVEVAGTALAPDTGDRPAFRYRQVTPAAHALVPTDVTGRGEWPARKLYGQRWNHFGAFGSSEGRAHDWLWGRLDGASALCEYLVGPGFRDDPLCQALAAAILAADGTSPAELAAGAQKAYDKTPAELFDDLAHHDPHGEADAIWLLADTVPEVLGEIPSVGVVLEAATSHDPTLPDTAGLVTRAKAFGVRVATLAIRVWVRSRIRSAVDGGEHR